MAINPQERLLEINEVDANWKFLLGKGQNLTFVYGVEDMIIGLENARARGNKSHASCFKDEENSVEAGDRLLQLEEEYDIFTLGVAIVNHG